MPLARDENGAWTLKPGEGDSDIVERSHPSYLESLPRYLTALEPAFDKAKEASEFNFLWSIFAIRGMQDAGWDPYETTLRIIDCIREAHKYTDGEAGQHIGLWLYGHILEASEPYEFIANLLDVASGGIFNGDRFPPLRDGGPPQSPGVKIRKLEEAAEASDLSGVILPLKEVWNRDLRNAIFHADYSLHGAEVRTIRPLQKYAHEEIMTLINRALAYHEAMSVLRKFYIGSYTESVTIPADERFTNNPGEMATVIVREGHGAVGLKDGWTAEELKQGCIPYLAGRFTQKESCFLKDNPTLTLLPAAQTN